MRHVVLAFIALASTVVLSSGCLSSDKPAPSGQVGLDGSVDAPDGGVDAAQESGSDAPGPVCDATPYGPYCWTACQQSAADWCASGGDCMDWPADVTAFCAVYTPAKAIDYLGFADTCGAYHALKANGADFGTTYYYDAATGKLVAAVFHDYVQGFATCIAGPSDFVEPGCAFQNFQHVPCPDGGATGADGGDAGVPDAAP
jgi:hypothetical protein